jgi:hypothetical protein
MMFKLETPALVADPGGEGDLRAVAWRAGTAGRRPVGAAGDLTIVVVVRTGERGAL